MVLFLKRGNLLVLLVNSFLQSSTVLNNFVFSSYLHKNKHREVLSAWVIPKSMLVLKVSYISILLILSYIVKEFLFYFEYIAKDNKKGVNLNERGLGDTMSYLACKNSLEAHIGSLLEEVFLLREVFATEYRFD